MTDLVIKKAKVHGTEVEVHFPSNLGEHSDKVLSMKAFTEWCGAVDRNFTVKKIEIQSVDMFGPKVGFIKFKATVIDKDKTNIPSIVFMRGAAVAVLFILRCDVSGEQFTILTAQPRFPTGKYQFADIPAGMVDDNGDFTGVCAKEIKEETGLEVNVGDLIDLTRLAIDKDNTVKSRGMPGVYPSCGGCDEYLKFYACRKTMKKDDIDALRNKSTGVAREHEKITLKIVSIHDLW